MFEFAIDTCTCMFNTKYCFCAAVQHSCTHDDIVDVVSNYFIFGKIVFSAVTNFSYTMHYLKLT